MKNLPMVNRTSPVQALLQPHVARGLRRIAAEQNLSISRLAGRWLRERLEHELQKEGEGSRAV